MTFFGTQLFDHRQFQLKRDEGRGKENQIAIVLLHPGLAAISRLVDVITIFEKKLKKIHSYENATHTVHVCHQC